MTRSAGRELATAPSRQFKYLRTHWDAERGPLNLALHCCNYASTRLYVHGTTFVHNSKYRLLQPCTNNGYTKVFRVVVRSPVVHINPSLSGPGSWDNTALLDSLSIPGAWPARLSLQHVHDSLLAYKLGFKGSSFAPQIKAVSRSWTLTHRDRFEHTLNPNKGGSYDPPIPHSEAHLPAATKGEEGEMLGLLWLVAIVRSEGLDDAIPSRMSEVTDELYQLRSGAVPKWLNGSSNQGPSDFHFREIARLPQI